jgi:hypothetical protein
MPWITMNGRHVLVGEEASKQHQHATADAHEVNKSLKDSLPRTFYRGDNPGSPQRITTGDKEWDNHLFVSSDKDSASMYGKNISEYQAAKDAKILYEGTKEFRGVAGAQRKGENLLQFSSRAASAAKAKGYDAVWFKRQGDVGTAVINRDKFTKK